MLVVACGENLCELPVGVHCQRGAVGLLRSQSHIRGQPGRGAVDRAVMQKALQTVDQLAVVLFIHGAGTLAEVRQGGELHVPDQILQAEFLDLLHRGFEPVLRRRVAQPAEQRNRSDFPLDRGLGLLRRRPGRQNLLAGLTFCGRPLLIEFRKPWPETRRGLDLIQNADVFLQLLDRAVGDLEGVFLGRFGLLGRL